MNKPVYLDNAATTSVCDAAKKIIMENLDTYGNPSSVYDFGRKSKVLIEDAREKIATLIGAEPDEIYFTSGGSEADTWAMSYGEESLGSNIEHHALHSKYIFTVGEDGIADIKDIEESLKAVMDITSCMMVNNEIGTIQPIRDIAKMAHKYDSAFHTDAVQAMGHIPINVKELGVDMLSASGHKFGGLKGTGFLFIKKGIKLPNLINGGKQEKSRRPGTENILGIISMAAALEDCVQHIEEDTEKITKFSNKLKDSLLSIQGVELNGAAENHTRIYSNINIRVDGIKGSDLVTLCDMYGICISGGSACNEGLAEPSHVLKAIGLTNEQALSSIRITLGRQNTEEEIDYAAVMIPKLIKILREGT